MGDITGIELGPESCVLVRARRRGEALELSAAHVIGPAMWSTDDAVAADMLKVVRREKRFPRTARVAAWGLAEGAAPRDPATRAALRPLIAAGFRIDSVISPAHALAILAAARPRTSTGASAWLSVNRHGAAIAIVRGAELLFSRAFGWNWDSAAIGSQAQLLQRYSIVAHLAPEVRHGAEIVRAKFGASLDAAVTCGDLPDLRSLTMPLIEELDLEVETLDSGEGLDIPSYVRRDRLPESLSALRLACAAAMGPSARGLDIGLVRLARAAAVIAAVGGVAWAGYVWFTRPQPTALSSSSAAPATENPARAPAGQRRRDPVPAGSVTVPTSTTGVAAAPPSVSSPPPISNARPSDSLPIAPESARPVAPNPTPPRSNRPSPRVELPQTAGAPVPGAERPRPAQPAPASTDTQRARPRPQPSPTPPPQVVAHTPPRAVPEPAETPATASRGARPAPLKDPLPSIDTILVSSDRRLAVIDGAIVTVGDAVGPRSVVRIEVDAVFLREPSGLEIRVPIRVRRQP